MHTIQHFWIKLSEVNKFIVLATSKKGQNSGQGVVDVTLLGPHTLLFTEKGQWEDGIQFTNSLRWHLEEDHIRLEHMRRGIENPTFLIELKLEGDHLSSTEPHLCGADSYMGTLENSKEGLCLTWQIKGPKKDEQISCFYNRLS